MKIDLTLLEQERERAILESRIYTTISVVNRNDPKMLAKFERKTNTMDVIANLLWAEIQKQKENS